ncbi:MAG: pilus assembly protein TadG-related protein [Anaerolineales bacterium]|nr:pilus assembly protein TadG-related protein [Anaerolineales bacterium]MDW8447326.1 pilus assembly protein TadG-related protein [Anaerolineales bacterium]
MDHRFRSRPYSATSLRRDAQQLRRTDSDPRALKPKLRLQAQLEAGQALILVAIAFLVLLAIVGLTTDVGQLFIYYGHLRQAVDAAALAASGQFREARNLRDLTAAAAEAIELNGISTGTYTVTVQTCEAECNYFNGSFWGECASTGGGSSRDDPQLCTTPRRKLARVITYLDVPTIFLHLVGVQTLRVSANAIAEAASVDVVLVIDISDSMTFDAPIFRPGVDDPTLCRRLINGELPIPRPGDAHFFCLRDPSICNYLDPNGADGYPGECQPFEQVKRAALTFVGRILDKPAALEEDRLAIVTFANGWVSETPGGAHYRANFCDLGTFIRTGSGPTSCTSDVWQARWFRERAEAEDVIRNLKVFDLRRSCNRNQTNPSAPDYCYDPADPGDNDEPEYCYHIPNDPDSGVAVEYGPCLYYSPESFPDNPVPVENSFYTGYLDCNSCWATGDDEQIPRDWSYQATTNIGGGLRLAGNMFSLSPREDALWVVVMLTDGMANATDADREGTDRDLITDFNTYPVGNCSQTSLKDEWLPLCQDQNVSTRHRSGSSYDADDYARDMADFVGCLAVDDAEPGHIIAPGTEDHPCLDSGRCNPCRQLNGSAYRGQGAVIFAIGLGDEVINTINEVNGRPYGADLLRYIARVGYAGDPRLKNDPCKRLYNNLNEYKQWCGNYYFSPTGTQLMRIFEDIASRIFTRLVR